MMKVEQKRWMPTWRHGGKISQGDCEKKQAAGGGERQGETALMPSLLPHFALRSAMTDKNRRRISE